MNTLARTEQINRAILVIRGWKVMLDADLAVLYGVTTKRLNEQVKRNRNRFPGDFMFRLTAEEKAEVVAKCDHLQRLKFSPTLPYAFTEHGALMLASVLNSPIAIEVSIQIVRIFIRLRETLASHKSLRHRLKALEKKYDVHDVQIKKSSPRFAPSWSRCLVLRSAVSASGHYPERISSDSRRTPQEHRGGRNPRKLEGCPTGRSVRRPAG